MSETKTILSRRTINLLVAFVLILMPQFLTPPAGMSVSALKVLGIFAGVLVLWMTEAIDWPSLLCIATLGMLPELSFSFLFQNAFGNDTFVFLLCTFLCTFAISETPFLKRCALGFITSGFAKKGPWSFVISLYAAIIVIGCFMSPTVLFIIFLPIVEEINSVMGLKKGDKLAEMLIIGLAFCTSISAGMTPIAHVFSTMAMGFYEAATGITISYGEYMMFGVPVGIICVIALLLVFKFLLKPDMSPLKGVDVSHLKSELGAISKKEIFTVATFVVVIAMWVLPAIFVDAGILVELSTQIKSYGNAFPPMLGAIAYSIVMFDGQKVLNFGEAMKRGIPWPSLIMAGSTLAVGAALTNDEIGLKVWLIDAVSPLLQGVAPMVLVLVFVAWACVQTNLSSNMVTVTVVTNVAIPILLAMDGVVNTAAVVSLIGMMGAYAFATPPSMPHVAISIGSGWTNTTSMLKYGTLFMVITTVVAVFVGYPIAAMVM